MGETALIESQALRPLDTVFPVTRPRWPPWTFVHETHVKLALSIYEQMSDRLLMSLEDARPSPTVL